MDAHLRADIIWVDTYVCVWLLAGEARTNLSYVLSDIFLRDKCALCLLFWEREHFWEALC